MSLLSLLRVHEWLFANKLCCADKPQSEWCAHTKIQIALFGFGCELASLATKQLCSLLHNTWIEKQKIASGFWFRSSCWINYSFPSVPFGYSGSAGKEPACQCSRHKRHRFNPWVGKIPWRRKWQPTPVFSPGKFHGQKEPGGLQSMGPQSHTWLTEQTHMQYIFIRENDWRLCLSLHIHHRINMNYLS